jgi:hypothetical protein
VTPLAMTVLALLSEQRLTVDEIVALTGHSAAVVRNTITTLVFEEGKVTGIWTADEKCVRWTLGDPANLLLAG